MLRTLTPLLLLVTLSCGTSLMPGQIRGRGTSPKAKIADMEERILELRRQAAVVELEMARLREQLTRVEEMTAIQPKPGNVEVPEVTMPGAIEESDLQIGAGSVGTHAPDPQVQPPETAINPAGQALYDRGYTEFHQGRFLNSETSFRRFLQSYGRTELADNAQFWIGQARFARSDTQGALAAFQETVERYPQGNKVPDALLKIGECSQRLGDPAVARQVYLELTQRFPTTAAAATAQERLGRVHPNR